MYITIYASNLGQSVLHVTERGLTPELEALYTAALLRELREIVAGNQREVTFTVKVTVFK